MVTSCIAPLTSYKTSRQQTRTAGAGPDVACEQAFDILFLLFCPQTESLFTGESRRCPFSSLEPLGLTRRPLGTKMENILNIENQMRPLAAVKIEIRINKGFLISKIVKGLF